MKTLTGRSTRNWVVPCAVVLAVGLATGCGTDGIFGGGGAAPTPTAQQYDHPQEPDEEPADQPAAEPTPTAVSGAEEAPETPDPEESKDPDPIDFVGDIELSVEGRLGVEEFFFAATECEISPSRVRASGQGVDLSTGEPSTVVIETAPLEELGETSKFGIFQASGAIKVAVANEEYVSDGRMHTVEGHELPSMFTYRLEEPGVKYAVAWWAGGSLVSSGYVKVSCS